jgi:hypothetical protein
VLHGRTDGLSPSDRTSQRTLAHTLTHTHTRTRTRTRTHTHAHARAHTHAHAHAPTNTQKPTPTLCARAATHADVDATMQACTNKTQARAQASAWSLLGSAGATGNRRQYRRTPARSRPALTCSALIGAVTSRCNATAMQRRRGCDAAATRLRRSGDAVATQLRQASR